MMGIVSDLSHNEILTVGQRIKNKYLDRWIQKSRKARGILLCDKKQFLKRSLAFLKQGKSVAILADQNAGRHGIPLPFLGKTASTFTTPALFAPRTHRPIIPLFDLRDNRSGTHRIVMGDLIDPVPFTQKYTTRKEAVKALTQTTLHAMENQISAHPACWFWLHKRWKR